MATAGKTRKGSSGASRKPATRSKAGKQPSPWRWYGAGVVSGLLLSFLLYLGILSPDPTAVSQTAPAEDAGDEPPPARFDFYTRLPQQSVDVEVDPSEIATARQSPDTERFLLQAGSFKQREDADRRRAEMLLLGLEPRIEETNGSNGRWFRVLVGPFETRSQLAKARSLTAQQGIDTLLLKQKAD
jgi:cell division protein FtsN